MKFAVALFAALLCVGCTHRVKVNSGGPCSTVSAAPGVEPSPCAEVQALFESAKRCYSANVDPAVSRITLNDVLVSRIPEVGRTESGQSYILGPEGNVFGYYSLEFNAIIYNYTPVLRHEFMHPFALALHPETVKVIGHGKDGDPLMGVDCTRY